MARKKTNPQNQGGPNNKPGEINFASDVVYGADNKSSSLNFAQELEDIESKPPGSGDPDPNNYRAHDDGFVRNPVAGGRHPDDGAFTPEFVNGVDHEEAEPEPEEDEPEQVVQSQGEKQGKDGPKG